MTAAELAAFHDPNAKTLWMVFNRNGQPYFTTTYNLGPERHKWDGNYIVKEVRIHSTGQDVRLEVVS